MIDLNELSDKLDDALAKETPSALKAWIKAKRKRSKLALSRATENSPISEINFKTNKEFYEIKNRPDTNIEGGEP